QGGTVYGNEQSLKTVGYTESGHVGIVFYDKGSVSDGWRYLEAAPEDQSNSIAWWPSLTWVYTLSPWNITSYTAALTISTSTAIGTGKENTAAIIAKQTGTIYAAYICANYAGGSLNDWFLPSLEELHLMYLNMKVQGIGGLGSQLYWSSTQYNPAYAYGNAWSVYFSTTYSASSYPAYNTWYARAARRY
ncbi:MAG: hypothetical protein WCT14_13455, partial [Treponemataceae bacterium]